jgi:quercetin dioxygenase-like cupin family protein
MQKIDALPAIEKVDADAERMDTPYDAWVKSQGIEVFKGYFVEDLYTLPLHWWERKGGYGALINLEGTGYMDDAYVCAIPEGKSLKPESYLFEELVYVLEGRGATSIWQRHGPKQSFEWQKGSLFAIPLNAWHQHFNGEGDRQARLFVVTTAPLVFNLFHNEDFILNNPYVFADRFHGETGYFDGGGKLYKDRVLVTNFVSDVMGLEPIDWRERGEGNATVFFELAQSTMGAHISAFPVGIYKKAHRHGPGAHVIVLSGDGYSLMWPEGKEKMRIDWKPGSVLVPPEGWFHQHFNPGTKPARYLALKMLSRRYKLAPGKIKADVPLDQGGWQIEYEDEEPEIRRTFKEECRRSGARVLLPKRE